MVAEVQILTAAFLWVAVLDVLAGFGRVPLAAVRTAEVLQISTEALQCGVDAGVCPQCGRVLVGKGFIFVELGKQRRFGGHSVLNEFHGFRNSLCFVINQASKKVFRKRGGRSWGSWRARGAWFTRWALNNEND